MWAFLLSFVASQAQQVGFYVDEGFKIQQGGQATLSIGLQNDIDICGVQMHLYLPEGITIAEELNDDEEMAPAIYMSNRKKSQHVLYLNPTADGATQIVIAGTQAFRNNTGEILSIKLNVDPSVALGSYNIYMKNLAFSDLNAMSYEQDNITVPVRVFATYQISAVSADENQGAVSLTNGGEAVENGTSVVASATPEEGYEFVNWQVGGAEKSTANPYTFAAAENVALVATFRPLKYNVVFSVDGVETTSSLDYASVIPTPTAPSKTGYTFTGWEPAFEEGATVPLNGITYTAQWQVNQYTFTFDSNGGSDVAAITQDYGTEVTAPANPTREGYTFKGWDKAVPSTIPAADMTFTAQWQVNQYTFTFDSNGGSDVAAITQDYGTEVTAPANPTREGYTFIGWDKEVPSTIPAADMTFTAQWQVNQYTLTFDSNDGSTVVVALTQDYGSAVTAPDAFVREGYTFLGWDKDIPSTMPAENQSFKAQWQINKYKVVFVSENDVLSEATLDYGSAITVPEVPAREGYTFLGWEPKVDETVPAHDVTYRAQWNVNKYTLTFDSNGGTDVAAITQDYGTEVTAPAAPTREGYTFLSWDKDIPSTMPAENQSFTAQWQINQYQVVFVSENDVLSEATLDYGSAITVPEVPEREGYTFLGWEPEVDETVPAHDVTYRAQWQVNVYTLTYYVNDEVAYTVEVPYGTAIEPYTPEVPEGYEFKGWVEEVPATMPAHDVDIHGTVTIISGIAEVFVQAGGPVDVYSLQGKLVMRMTNAADARKLPNGIYVVNGVKVLQKR
ncbi:MAG: InlB B-repeat-containing protein [Bacteroidales bacterium]|nr:InlB B-repeat-containing protein [Bacteroidales bacterium]